MSAVSVKNIWKRLRLKQDHSFSLSQALRFKQKKNAQDEFFWALKDISFSIEKGESLGIIGANGSGKSTLLKILTKIMKPTKGSIVINGRVSALIELGAGFHGDFTGRENIYLSGLMMGMSKREIRDKLSEIISFSELESFIDVPVKYYSSGMMARLGFSVATAIEPDVLIVDEVLAVGDLEFQKKSKAKIHAMKEKGTTILFVSHSMSDVESICDKVLWIHKGDMVMFGDASSILTKYVESGGKPH